jgi:excisionase family DNA binding protein
MNDQTLLSPRQFGEALGITMACTRRWILLRKISHIKLGRLVKIPCSEVNRLVEQGFVPARPERGGRHGE